MGSCRIYVGNLPLDCRERELEDLFYKYGRIVNIDLKLPPRPPGFAFIQFEDPRDAEEAVRGRDGYDFSGNRLRVEVSHGGRAAAGGFGGGGGSYGGGYGGGGGGGSYGGGYGGGGGGGRYGAPSGGSGGGGGGGRSMGPSPFGPSRRTDYRVIVSGLPPTASWQDLKDHMRRAGDVTFAQVMRDREGRGMIGLVDYAHRADMDTALRKLDDSEFKNPFDKCYIRVKQDRGDGIPGGSSRGGRSRSRSRSRDKRRSERSRSRSKRSKSRSKSRSPSKSRSRSRSRSKSPEKSRSRSRSASPAKSESRSRSRSRSASPQRSGSPAKENGSPARSQ